MKSFIEHLEDRKITELAEECVRYNLPLEEFVEWYTEQGQFLEDKNFLGTMAGHMGTGAGIGSFAGPVGAGIGAGVGALTGLGHYGYQAWKAAKERRDAKKSGVYTNTVFKAKQLLAQLANLSQNPKNKDIIEKVVNFLKSLRPDPAERASYGTGPKPEPGKAVVPYRDPNYDPKTIRL